MSTSPACSGRVREPHGICAVRWQGVWCAGAQICLVYYHLGCHFEEALISMQNVRCREALLPCICFFLVQTWRLQPLDWKIPASSWCHQPSPGHRHHFEHFNGRIQDYFDTSNSWSSNKDGSSALSVALLPWHYERTNASARCFWCEQDANGLLHVMYLSTGMNHMTF